MITEEEVYNGAKRWLENNGFVVLAGQPARGVDHLPVIEIKNPSGNNGSESSYKPDLVAYKENQFYIIECKPVFNKNDNDKINSILSSPTRLKSFYVELEQYMLFDKIAYHPNFKTFSKSVNGILSFSGKIGPDCKLNKLIVENWQGKAIWI